MKANVFIGVAGIPEGWELVTDEAVEHPQDRQMGALIRNASNGNYALFNAGTMRNYPKAAGNRIAGIKSGWGGHREGAGRKSSGETKINWQVRVTADELAKLKAYLEELRK